MTFRKTKYSKKRSGSRRLELVPALAGGEVASAASRDADRDRPPSPPVLPAVVAEQHKVPRPQIPLRPIRKQEGGVVGLHHRGHEQPPFCRPMLERQAATRAGKEGAAEAAPLGPLDVRRNILL